MRLTLTFYQRLNGLILLPERIVVAWGQGPDWQFFWQCNNNRNNLFSGHVNKETSQIGSTYRSLNAIMKTKPSGDLTALFGETQP